MSKTDYFFQKFDTFKRNVSKCLFYLLIFVLNGCSNNSTERNVINLLEEGIYLKDDRFIKNEFTVFRYVKPKSCTSCELQMGRWRVLERRMNNEFDNRINFIFLIDTKSYNEAKNYAEIYGFKENVIIDTVGDFIKENPSLEFLGNDITLLLDSIGNIMLIGDPNKSSKINSTYKYIFSGEYKKLQENTKKL